MSATLPSRPEPYARISLALLALVYLGLGVAFLARPGWIEQAGLLSQGVDGTIEVRAMYGGLELGIGAFLGLCVVQGHLWAGHAFSACSFAGLGGARGLAFLLAGQAPALHLQLLGVEVVCLGVSAAALWRMGRSPGEEAA